MSEEIIFTEDYEVQDGSGTVHKRGSTLPCSEATAEHFKRKGVAEELSGYKERLAAKQAAEDEKKNPPPAPTHKAAAHKSGSRRSGKSAVTQTSEPILQSSNADVKK